MGGFRHKFRFMASLEKSNYLAILGLKSCLATIGLNSSFFIWGSAPYFNDLHCLLVFKFVTSDLFEPYFLNPQNRILSLNSRFFYAKIISIKHLIGFHTQ